MRDIDPASLDCLAALADEAASARLPHGWRSRSRRCRNACASSATRPLGVMHCTAVASPDFVRAQLPRGLGRDNFAHVPFLVFNR